MEWISSDRCRWNERNKNTHVYLPVRDMGRLDEKYLPGSARPAFHAYAGCVWWIHCTHRRVFPTNLAPDRNSLVSRRRRLDGGLAHHPVNVAVGAANLRTCKG